MMGGGGGVKGQENLTSPLFDGCERVRLVGGGGTISLGATPMVYVYTVRTFTVKVYRETNRTFSV